MKNNEPAFPHLKSVSVDKNTLDLSLQIEIGMSLRDYFAAKALCGILANSNKDYSEEGYVEYSYKIADAMLEARQK